MNVRRWWPPVVWAVLVLLVNSIPGGALPSGAPGVDKTAHLVLYGVLGVLGARAALGEARGDWRAVALVLLAVAAFGAVDELHQALVPGRSMDVGDWVADLLGASVGAGATAVLMQRHNPNA